MMTSIALNPKLSLGTAASALILFAAASPPYPVAAMPVAQLTDDQVVKVATQTTATADASAVHFGVKDGDIIRELERIARVLVNPDQSIPFEHEKVLFEKRWDLYI